MTAPSLPSWVRELVTLLPACAHFLLSGNVRDQYLVPADDGEPRLRLGPRRDPAA